MNLRSVLMIIAVLCFFLAACGIGNARFDRVNLTAAGLTLWALATLIS